MLVRPPPPPQGGAGDCKGGVGYGAEGAALLANEAPVPCRTRVPCLQRKERGGGGRKGVKGEIVRKGIETTREGGRGDHGFPLYVKSMCS